MLSKPSSLSLILFAGGMFAFSPLSTDIFIPSMPGLVATFDTTVPVVQLTLSLYLLAFAASKLIYGPIADRFGRKPTILGGIAVYLIGSVACLVATSIEMLVAARVLQAIGAAFGMLLGRAVIRDLHDSPRDAARVLAYATMIMGSTSLFIPSVGALVTVHLGWRVIFAILTAYGLFYFLLVGLGFRESLREKATDAIQPRQMLANFATLFRSRVFLRYTVSISCMFGVLFTFLSGSPFVFIDVYGVPTTHFGLIFTAMAGSFTIASAIMGRIGSRFSPHTVYPAAAAMSLLSGATALALAASGIGTVVTLVASMAALSFAMGLMVPLAFAGALAPHPTIAGTASTLIGFVQGVFSAGMGVLVGLLFDGTGVPMFALIAALTVGGLVSYLLIRPRPATSMATT